MLLRELLLDTLLLPDELLLRELLLEIPLLFDELLLRELLLDTPLLLLDELLLRELLLDTPLLLDELLPLLRDTPLLDELLREADEPVRVIPELLLLRTGVLVDSLRRVAVVALLLRLEVALRLSVVVASLLRLPVALSARLEPVRTGVPDTTAVRRFSSESTLTMREFLSREGMLTKPALRSRRFFS